MIKKQLFLLRQIQELIKFVAKSGATEVDLEIGDVKLSIKSPPKGKTVVPEVIHNQYLPPVQAQPVQAQPVQAQPVAPSIQTIEPVKQVTEENNQSVNQEQETFDNYITKVSCS